MALGAALDGDWSVGLGLLQPQQMGGAELCGGEGGAWLEPNMGKGAGLGLMHGLDGRGVNGGDLRGGA